MLTSQCHQVFPKAYEKELFEYHNLAFSLFFHFYFKLSYRFFSVSILVRFKNEYS